MSQCNDNKNVAINKSAKKKVWDNKQKVDAGKMISG